MKLTLCVLCLAFVVMAKAKEIYPHMPYTQYVDKVLGEALDFLPMGEGMIELPNFLRNGSCKTKSKGSSNVSLKTLHVILSGMKLAATNGHCVTKTGKSTNVTNCQFSIPKVSIRLVVNATESVCSDNKLANDCDSTTWGYLHFLGSPQAAVTGNFILTKILKSVKPSTISNFQLNQAKFNFVKPPEEAQSELFQCMFGILQTYGTGTTFKSSLEQQLPVFIQKVFNRDIY